MIIKKFFEQLRSSKIQARLIMYYILYAVITVASVAYFAYTQAVVSLRSTVEDKLETVAELKVDFLDQWVDEQQRNAILLASLPDVRLLAGQLLNDDSTAVEQELARERLTELVTLITQRTAEFQDIQILDRDGMILISAAPLSVGQSQAGQQFFIDGQTRTVVQRFYKSELFGNTILTVATPLFDHNNKWVGVLALHLNIRKVDDIIRADLELKEPIQSYLISPQHKVITDDPIMLSRSLEFQSLGIDQALLGLSGTASYINHDGVAVIGRYAWIESHNAALIIEINEEIAMRPARQLAFNIVIAGLIISLALMLAVVIFARQMTAPLLALTETATRISAGDMNAMAAERADDEVGMLARAFNSMKDKLSETLVGLQAELREKEHAEAMLRQNEIQIRATNDFLRSIMDSPKGVIIFSLNRQYEYTAYTQSHREIMKRIWSADIAIGMNLLDYIHDSEARANVKTFFDKALAGEYFAVQEEPELASPFQTWWESRYSPIVDEANQIVGLTVVVIDITERKKMELALRESEEKFRKIFHSSPVATCITVLEDGKLLEANYAYWDLTGYDPATSIGKNAEDLKMWDVPEERLRFVRDLRTRKSLFNADDYFYHVDGSLRHVISFYELLRLGSEDCVLAMFYDMSAQKRTMHALEQSEARTRALLEALPDLIVELSPDGQVVNIVLPSDTEISMSVEGVVGESIQKLLPEAVLPQALTAVRQALQDKRMTVFEFEDVRSGDRQTLEARIAASASDTAILIIRDVTRRKWAETEREKLIHELELKNRESETLRDSLASIITTFDLNEVIERILDQIKLVIPYDTASVWRVDGEWQTLMISRDLPREVSGPDLKFHIDFDNSSRPIILGEKPFVLNNDVQNDLADFKGPHSYIHSWLAVPLKKRNRIIGLIALDGKKQGQFTEHHAELAVAFANQVAIAFDNADLFSELQDELAVRERLISELEDKNAEAETMRESLASIVGTFEFSEIIQRILDQIRRVVPYDSASIWRLEEDRQILIGERDLPPELSSGGLEFTVDESNHSLPIFKGEKPYIISHDVQADYPGYQVQPHNYINSWLGVPLKVRGQIIGLIALDGRLKSQFNQQHAQLAVMFADQVAIALENARLFSDLQAELRKQIALRSASMSISSSLHLDQVLKEVCKQMCVINNGTSAYISQYDAGYSSYTVMADYMGVDANASELLSDVGMVYYKKDGAYIFDDAQGLDFEVVHVDDENLHPWIKDVLSRYGGKSILFIPLYVQGRLLGHAELWDSRGRHAFTRDEISFCRVLCQQAAIAIANASLFEQLQKELKEKQNLIAELESKNAELERFTYTVSHDLKSPLFTIRGFLGYLKQDALAGKYDRVQTDMQRIIDATEKMQMLLNDLLELSRVGRLKNEATNISFEALVNEAVELVQGRIMERRIAVRTQPGLPSVFGDRPRLLEVLQNLIDNAAKFMGNQNEPLIEIGQDGEEDDRFVFYVRDNGMGIAPEHYERVFGLFNKLDVKSDGTGIGLALVRRIVEVHEGRIWVESEVGKGSTFKFTLPRARD